MCHYHIRSANYFLHVYSSKACDHLMMNEGSCKNISNTKLLPFNEKILEVHQLLIKNQKSLYKERYKSN